MQFGVVLRANLPIEVHASKVYTRKMFEQFGKKLYESGQYNVEELEHHRLYLARHDNAAVKERWCKVTFAVSVDIESDRAECECGYFAHSGMLCAHSLKVIRSIHVYPTIKH